MREGTGYWSNDGDEILEGDIILFEQPGTMGMFHKILGRIVFVPYLRAFCIRPWRQPQGPYTQSLNYTEGHSGMIITILGSMYDLNPKNWEQLDKEYQEWNEQINRERIQAMKDRDEKRRRETWWRKLWKK